MKMVSASGMVHALRTLTAIKVGGGVIKCVLTTNVLCPAIPIEVVTHVAGGQDRHVGLRRGKITVGNAPEIVIVQQNSRQALPVFNARQACVDRHAEAKCAGAVMYVLTTNAFVPVLTRQGYVDGSAKYASPRMERNFAASVQ